MKVGDIVVKNYAWEKFRSGIIIEEYDEMITDDPSYTIVNKKYIVHWSDGTIGHELYEELIYIEQYFAEMD